MITQHITSNGICDPNKWLQSSMRGIIEKLQNIRINNGDVEKTPLCWEKTTMIYGYIKIAQKSTCNVISNQIKWSHPFLRSNCRETWENNNRKRQNKSIVLGEKKPWYIATIWYLGKVISGVISHPNEWLR